MRGFEVDAPARLEQPRGLLQQQSRIAQMFDQVHAGDGIHRSRGPGQPVPLKIGALELAAGGIFLRRALPVCRKEPEVRSQLGDVAQRLAIRRAQVQQGASPRRAGDKPGAGIHPGKRSQASPVHGFSQYVRVNLIEQVRRLRYPMALIQ